MLEILGNIFNAILIAFGQFNIEIIDSKDGIQIQASFLTFSCYLIVFILFVIIIVASTSVFRV